MKEFDSEIKKVLDVLKNKGTILYPTDTIWGIGCDATSPEAIEKIFQLKKRSKEKNLILLLDDSSRLLSYVKEVPDAAWNLIEYSEKPLTIIYDGARNLPSSLIAEDGTIAIRITTDEFCKKLIQQFKKPIISTSANFSGSPSPACFDDIDPELMNGVDYVVNWRRSEKSVNKQSAIIQLKLNGQIKFIRK